MSVERIENVASYVPALIARQFAEVPVPPHEPRAEVFPAAVLFADVSGFTALTEALRTARSALRSSLAF